MCMQHNFIETLEATSIHKQENGSAMNIKGFFLRIKMTDWESGGEKNTPKVWTSSGRCICFIQKITYEIFQVYRNIV